ncbi:hypothetical protein ASD11_16760 [Aeromicrobium sp. Root495]|uniref:hypothetical protein n=1 Tax=Aeromicrobium sp. Root495 TaxID=1736550 RepID=UPI0006F88E63|nr:hypothetical protein [Aeromicrobium sp. Root495]KQY56114.1 hypothetical protein ASD11_16760 [Aeromicrobium sp. Root495]
MTTTSRWRGRAAAAAAASALALVPVAAHAATIVTISYDASGTSHIAKTNSDVALGPTTLTTNLDIDTGDFTGSLPLPGTSTEFKAAGFLPVKADVDFVEAAPLVGRINLTQTQAQVASTATYYVKLSNIKIVGFPTFTGSSCRTKVPVSIPVGTKPNEGFDLINGGELVGTYSIGQFENCGANTWLINALVPGGGNTVDIQVSNGIVHE